MVLKALIFDCDGTIADTEEAHRTAFNCAFADAGLDWHWSVERYRKLLETTGGRERIARYVIEEKKTSVDVASLHNAKNSIYADLVARGKVALRPGIIPLMQQASQAGLALAIATTTSRDNLDALVDATALRTVKFSASVCGEDVARKKPDPAVYRIALDRLCLPATACIAFEDSWNGLRASCGAGLTTIVTPNHYTEGSDFTGAALVTNDLARDIVGDDGIASIGRLVVLLR